jgi:hypothetical protein
MRRDIRDAVTRELQARGFSADLLGPSRSLAFSPEYLETETLAGLYDLVVSRREKMFRGVPELGQEIARAAYDDAVIAVQAVGAVISQLAGDI